MKHFNLIKTFLLLFALVVGGGSSAWATDVVLTQESLGLTGGYTSNTEKTVEGITFVYSDLMKNGNNIQAKASSGVIYNKTAFPGDITNVSITHSGTARSTTIHGSSDGTNWTLVNTGSGSVSADFTNKGYRYFKITRGSNAAYWTQIVVSYSTSAPTTVSTPSITPDGGTYTSAQDVTLTCTTEGAAIHYTTNGEDPTESDDVYTSPVPVTITGTVLKAKAFKDGLTASSIAEATYVIKPNKPSITSTGSMITISGDSGCTFYYTTDGSEPDNTKTKYTGPFELLANCTIKAKAYDAYENPSDAQTLKHKYMPLAPKNINSGYFEKVTDVSTLENGDAILVVCENHNLAMSTEQNANNRGQVSISLSNNATYVTSADVQKFVLVKTMEKLKDTDTDTDVFYFYTGSGYLYASSSSSNNLKTEETPDDNNNARAIISISNGDATIKFSGTNSHNLLKHNNSSKIFSCYASGQESVQIYKEVPHSESIVISEVGYATYCSSAALDFTGITTLTAYTASKDNNTNAIIFNKVEGKVPANTGLLVSGETTNVPVCASADPVDNLLVGVTTETVKDANTIFVLMNGSKGIGFYKNSNAFTLRANSAYLPAEAVGTAGARAFIGFDDETTGIAEVNTQKEDAKRMFDLQGRKVTKAAKGLYIVDGRKVVVK